MTSSGTEASMSAIRLARAATGRDAPGQVRRRLPRPRRRPARRGRLRARHAGHPVLARRARGRRRGDRRSCPGTTSRPCAPRSPPTRPPRSWPSPTRPTWASSRPRRGFLEGLRELATESGALLVFDEVITGFRVAPGGAQELTGVMPDLTDHGQGHRRRAPGRGLRRPGRADVAHRAGRRRLPGGHAEREPAGRRRRPRRAARRSTRRPTCASPTPRARSPPGCARPRARGRSRSPRRPGC